MTQQTIAQEQLSEFPFQEIDNYSDAEKPLLCIGIKSNMLYDAVAVPNLAVEWSFSKYWSVSLSWMYAWWNRHSSNFFLRTYGGDFEVRHWLGHKSSEKSICGHHFGIYGQILTYDIEFGHRGYLGDRWSYGLGFSYGYSLPIKKRLNIDFSIGVGYLGGKYKEYEPMDGHYIWQSTKQRNWFGPTKIEISLVWLIGYRNTNERKGDSQ